MIRFILSTSFLLLITGNIRVSAQLFNSGFPDVNGTVYTTAKFEDTLYFGGNFTAVNGQPRQYAAAIRITDGALLPWNPGITGGSEVRVIKAQSNKIYIGGNFTLVNGTMRNGIALTDAQANLLNWDPQLGIGQEVRAIAFSQDKVYLGGSFSTVQGNVRLNFAEVDSTGGTPTGLNIPHTDIVYDIVIKDSILFTGGNFANAGGQPRNKLAGIDLNSGSVLSWNPLVAVNFYGFIWDMHIHGDDLYIAGIFTGLMGTARSNVASVHIPSLTLNAWNPGTDTYTFAIHVIHDTILIGGSFSMAGGQPRPAFAAFAPGSNTPTSWNIAPDAAVYTIETGCSDVIVGGSFTGIANQSQNRLAGFSFGQSFTLNVTGPVAFCTGDSTLLHTFLPGVHQWMNGSTSIPGATDSLLQVNGSGAYYAIYESQPGCFSRSDTAYIAVYPLPPQPVISLANDSLFAYNGPGFYQWYFENNLVPGAAQDFIDPGSNFGSYHITYTDTNGCSSTSAPFIYANSDIMAAQEPGFNVYPNPASDIVTIIGKQPATLYITGMDGTIQRSYIIAAGKQQIQPQLPAGIYLLRYITEKGSQHGKLVITD